LNTKHLIFITIICLFVTLIKYELGESDQLSQMPLVIKEMNSNFIPNDFFVEANETFGPRFYYSKFMAAGSFAFSIQGWFFLISFVCCFLSAYFTYRTAQYFFKNETASLLSVIFLVALPTPTLAESTFTTYEGIFTPSALIFPFLLAAFYYFFEKKWIVLPLLLTGIASLFQVLYGLTTSLLILWAYFGSSWKFGRDSYPIGRALIGIVILILFASANLLPYFMGTVSEKMTTEEFVQIVAFFRNPHHYAASLFPLLSWVLSLFFFAAAGMTFYFFYKKEPNQTEQPKPFYWQIILVTIAILGAFVGGYLFVEVFPSRIWTTAQTFRYVILLKWFSCIFLAGWLVEQKWSLFAAVHPIALFFSTFFKNKTTTSNAFLKKYATPILLIATVILLGVVRLREDILVLIALFLIFVFLLYTQRVLIFKNKQPKIVTTGMLIITLGLAVTPLISPRFLPASLDGLLAKVYPKYDFAYRYDNDLKELADFITAETPEDAIFITPPNLPQIRFAANRAIVVDFKSFPYQDEYMLKWRERMLFCYGETNLLGFDGQNDLTEKFITVSYKHLQAIQRNYKATYAIVEKGNDINENVIFENDSYRVIKIVPSVNG
jgi:hypothetical protein